jgi:outer membrane receptor for ferrienterochelin and colicins
MSPTCRFVRAAYVLLTFAANTVFAQETSDKDKTADLVFSASKLPKNLGEAPAIITVYQHDLVETFGFMTLNDLLQTTPGFEQRSASWYNTPATRGVSHTALLMIDGTPINSHLTNMYPADYGLDISNYKRVEVISGPGGVLWGAHSLLGVINLLSLDGSDLNTVRGRIDLGSFGVQRYSVKGGLRWKDLDGMLSVTFSTWRGPNVFLKGTTSQTPAYGRAYVAGEDGETTNHSSYVLEVLGKLRYKHFTLFARIPYSRDYFQVSEEGGRLGYSDNGFRQSDDWLIYLKYDRQFLERSLGVIAKAYLYRNVMAFDDRLWSANTKYPNGYGIFMDNGTALKFGGLAEVFWTRRFGRYITNTATAGIDAFRESVSGAKVSASDANGIYSTFQPLISDSSGYVLSAYVSDDITLLDRLALSGGVRYNYSNTYSPVYLVSGSAVVRPWGQNYIKANIATGLRPPTMAMRFGLPPYAAPLGIYQDRGDTFAPMQPDTSTSYQFELNSQILKDVWKIKSFFVRGDFAYTSVDNIRTLFPSVFDPGILYYLPKLNRTIYSAEARLEASFQGDHELWVSYSYTKVLLKDASIPFELPQVGPRNAVSVGGSVRALSFLRLMARATIQAGETASLVALDPKQAAGGTLQLTSVDPIYLVNAGVAVDHIWRDLRLSFWATNILNHHYGQYAFQNQYSGGFVTDGQVLNYPQPGVGFMFSAQMSAL